MTADTQIITGDALELIPTLEDESVALVVTFPTIPPSAASTEITMTVEARGLDWTRKMVKR